VNEVTANVTAVPREMSCCRIRWKRMAYCVKEWGPREAVTDEDRPEWMV